jgi:hypothetical protein
MSLRLSALTASPIQQRDHVIHRLRNLVEDQSRMIAKLTATQPLPEPSLPAFIDTATSSDSQSSTSSNSSFDQVDDHHRSHYPHQHTTHSSNQNHNETVPAPPLSPSTPPPYTFTPALEQQQQHHQQHHQHHHQHHQQQHHGHPQNNITPTILNLQQQLHQAQLHATQIQNTTNSDFKLQLQHTKLQLNRSSQRKQKQLEATINTLRTQLIQGQKIRLQLDNKLADHARQIQTLREQYSTEKEKKLQLQFISETQEKSLWRMAAQIEVGSPYSHLAQDAIQPIIDELKTKLKNTLQDNSDLQHQFNGVTARVEVETQRAAAIQAEYDFQVQENGALKKEVDSEKRKVENEKKKVESEKRKCEEKLEKLRQIHQEEEMQHRKLLLSLEEDHQTTKDLLVQEKQLSENTIHQLSQVELDLETANKRNEKMEDQLLHATENAKKEYKDIVARLDEAVARNEAREDSFSSHWTASNFRTAVSAGDAAANLLGGHAALH